VESGLLVVIALGGVGSGRGDFTLGADLLPQFSIIKLSTIGIAGGVVNILDVDKIAILFMGDVVIGRLHGQLIEQGLHGVNYKKGLLALAWQTLIIVACLIRCER